jgi:hypothetical protein
MNTLKEAYGMRYRLDAIRLCHLSDADDSDLAEFGEYQCMYVFARYVVVIILTVLAFHLKIQSPDDREPRRNP